MSLKELYKNKVIRMMREKFGYKNDLTVPTIEKIVVNTGLGKLIVGSSGKDQQDVLKNISPNVSMITGQMPKITRAKKSISAFKIRKGFPLGLQVTLRRKRMYDFLERLIDIALPRSRDFRGIPMKSIDRHGILTIGMSDIMVFPEVLPDELKYPFGISVTIVTNAKSREEAIELFRLMGIPFAATK